MTANITCLRFVMGINGYTIGYMVIHWDIFGFVWSINIWICNWVSVM